MFRIPEDYTSKYMFVTLASLRAEQLQSGAPPRVESRHTKATLVAQHEVAAGLVEPWDPEEGQESGETAEE